MSKYGNGTGIAEVIRSERNIVEDVLNEYSMHPSEKKIVLDALMEMAYQWANANAWACVLEELLQKKIGDGNETIKAAIIGQMVAVKMKEYGDLFDEEEDE